MTLNKDAAKILRLIDCDFFGDILSLERQITEDDVAAEAETMLLTGKLCCLVTGAGVLSAIDEAFTMQRAGEDMNAISCATDLPEEVIQYFLFDLCDDEDDDSYRQGYAASLIKTAYRMRGDANKKSTIHSATGIPVEILDVLFADLPSFG